MNKAQEYFTGSIRNSNTKRFKKTGTVLFRFADIGETVLTMTSGQLETTKSAKLGEIVVRNFTAGSSAESYIIGPVDKFLSRYDVADKTYNIEGRVWGSADASGKVDAVEYTGPEFTFVSPWGDDMICKNGDMICKIPDEPIEKVYRIERAAFDATYCLSTD